MATVTDATDATGVVGTSGRAVAGRSDADATGGTGRRARPEPGALGLAAVFTTASALGGWLVGIRRLADNSFFVHLVTGRSILEHGIPHADTYSFTAPGHRFVAQSWLAEAMYGALDRVMGPVGIRLLIGVIGALLFGGLYRLALHTSGDRRRAAGLVAAALLPVVSLFDERPLAIGLLGLLVTVWCVELPDSWLGRRPLLVLPATFWVWGNAHGSFALGLAYLALHVVGRALDGAPVWRASRERTLVVAALASAAVLCVNPYGPALLWFPLALLGKGAVLRNVVEWRSPDFHTLGPMAFAAFLAVAVTALVRGGTRPSRRDLVVTLPFVLLALWALRNVSVATIVVLPVLGRAVQLRHVRPSDGDRERDVDAEIARARAREHRVAVRFITVVVALGALLTMVQLSQPSFNGHGYSVEAMRAIERQGLEGRHLVTTDANAAYVLLHAWPRQRVFMDDRYDMFPTQVALDYMRIAAGTPEWRSLLAHYGVDVVVWPRDRALAALLALDPAWHLRYRDRGWVVYARTP